MSICSKEEWKGHQENMYTERNAETWSVLYTSDNKDHSNRYEEHLINPSTWYNVAINS